jgi:hypothetical protein
MPRTLLEIDVRYTYDFGKEVNDLPIRFIEDYITDGGNPINLEQAMPKQVYLSKTKALKTKILKEDRI